jgi:hypothetical protein
MSTETGVMVTDPVPLAAKVTVSPPGPAATGDVTVSIRLLPSWSVAVAGIRLRAGGGDTVSVVSAVIGDPVGGVKVAVMVVVPTLSALATPVALPMVATAVADDVHATCVVSSCVVPSVRVPVAVKETVSPTNTFGDDGVRVSETSSGAVTTTFALALPPLSEAVIVAVPCPTVFTGKSAVSEPAGTGTLAGTVATLGALLVRVTDVGAVGALLSVTRSTPGLPFGKVNGLCVGGTGPSAVTTGGGGVTWTVELTLEPLRLAVRRAFPVTSPVTGTVAWV